MISETSSGHRELEAWEARDLVVLLLGQWSGAVVLLMGFVGSSHTSSLFEGSVWLAISLLGCCIGGVAATTWLLSAHRRVHLREQAIKARTLAIALALADSQSDRNPGHRAVRLVQRGVRHYHRPNCLLVAGKATEDAIPDQVLMPCGVCNP